MTDKNTEKKNLEDYDSRMQTLIRIEMEKAEKRRKLLIGFLALIAVGSLGYFGFYYATSSKSGGRFDELSDLVGSDALSNMDKDSGAGYIASLSQKDNDEVTPDVLEKYRTLYNSNRDLIGWIKIPDTVIDYPVMQASDNSYFLNTDPFGEYSLTGSIFLDSRCSPDFSDRFSVIYGHHMDYGKMFGSLDDFLNEPYMKSHRTGTLMTGRNADKVYKLEVFASMKVSSTEKTVFDMDSARIAAFIRNSADVQIADKDKRIVALATCSDANTLTKTVVFCYIVE
jgi:sortase B